MHPALLTSRRPAFMAPLRVWRVSWLLTVAVLFAGLGSAFAQDLSAKTKLSRQTATVGELLQLEIRVDGTRRPTQRPPDLRVDGLDIRYVGPQTRIEMRNFEMSTSVTYNYQVVPERAGQYTIPATVFQQDNQDLRTQPVALRVEEGNRGRRNAPQGRQAQNGGIGRIGWAEIILPKQTAYVGETIPVELRLLVDAAIKWGPESMPELEGEGFTKTKMPEPTREVVTRNGREYDVLVFRTAITPNRAGKVKIGPADVVFNAVIPRAQRNRARSPFDDDFFQDFFNDPFSGMGRTEQRKATAEPVELTVSPVPAEGKPESFAGAVGSFSMAVEGTPKAVKLGDPVTMRIRLSGRGNFDRVSAPAIADPQGWRSYPPTSDFKPEDEVSYRGTKTFEMAVIAEEKKSAMPQYEFSFFDPEAEKYVVLRSEPTPLLVQGEAKPAVPVPAPSRAQAPPEAAPPPEVPEAAGPTDILGLRYDLQPRSSFTPLYLRPVYWWAQLIPAAALLLLVASRFRTRPSAAAARAASLRRERSALRSRLQRESSSVDFFDAAVRAIQLETALRTGHSPDAVDASTARRSLQLSDETAAGVDQIFSAHAEMRYAGTVAENGHVSEAERSRVLTTLNDLEKSHGRN